MSFRRGCADSGGATREKTLTGARTLTDMRRRTVLAGAGSVVAGVASTGCLGSPRSIDALSTPTKQPPTGTELALGDAATLAGTELSVLEAGVRDVGVPPYSAFAVLEDPDGWQFVVVGVDSPNDGMGRDAAFEVSYHPWIDGELLEYSAHAPGFDGPPLDSSDDPSIPAARGPDVGQGVPVALPVPVGEYDQVGVVVGDAGDPDDSAYWHLGEVTDLLALEPNYRVHEATLVAADELFLELTIENDGDRDGVFQGILVLDTGADIDEVFTVGVPAGETVTERVSASLLSLDRVDEQSLPDVTHAGPGGRTFRI